MDIISDVLNVVRLNGALFLNAEFGHPWKVSSPCGQDIAQAVMPNSDNVIVYHLVTHGQCFVSIDGEKELLLNEGDIVIFPHGDAHNIGSNLATMPIDMSAIIPTLLNPNLDLLKTPGESGTTNLICGWLAAEQNIINPLMNSLPRLLKVNIRQHDSGKWLENSIIHAVDSASSVRAGAEAMTKKLAEILFLETLRFYMESLPDDQLSWLAGMKDKHVGKALSLIHAEPAKQWTVELLAQQAFVSRSVLAEKFKSFVGKPPMKYLARWRLAIAASLLQEGKKSIAWIIEEIGYESDTSFSRAFKKEFGVPPSGWREKFVSQN